MKSIRTDVPAVNPDPVTVTEPPARPKVGLRTRDAAAAGVAGITITSSETIMATARVRKILLYFI